MMAQAQTPEHGERPSDGLVLEPGKVRLLLLRQSNSRREGSLAAALAQSMALAIIGTAGAYPSWVLVTNSRQQMVLGASWAINQADPPWGSPLLGATGGALMLALAFCCLSSVVTASAAIGLDFLGRRKCRRLGPALHCLTALLITCTAVLGSSLLALVRGRTHTVPELQSLKFTATPGQSLFLSFLASALAATAAALSCSSPALVAPPAHSSSRGVRSAERRRRSSNTDSEDSPAVSPQYSWQDDRRSVDSSDLSSSSQEHEERLENPKWSDYLKRRPPQKPWKDRWWARQPRQQQQPAAEAGEARYVKELLEPAVQEEERAMEKSWEPKPLPQTSGTPRECPPPQFLGDHAVHARHQGETETDQEDPGRRDAELQLSSAPASQSEQKPPQASESQTTEAGKNGTP